MRLTETEWSFVANALRCAADKYMSNATELNTVPGMSGLVDQFKHQHQQAIELAERIEDVEGV